MKTQSGEKSIDENENENKNLNVHDDKPKIVRGENKKLIKK